MRKDDKRARFEQLILPHLHAAYNYARWLTRNEDDARDVVQEAFLRAYKFFDGFHGEGGKSWLLAIVRNTWLTWREEQQGSLNEEFDEQVHQSDRVAIEADIPFPHTPEQLMAELADRELLTAAIEQLPIEFREAIVMRELEGLSYKEIAKACDVPMGTVMSRLARGRKLLQQMLAKHLDGEVSK